MRWMNPLRGRAAAALLPTVLIASACGGAEKPSATPTTSAGTTAPASSGGNLVAAHVAVGGAHACAVTSNGQVYCWGANSSGEVGSDGPGARSAMLVRGVPKASEVALGEAHSCARTVEGTVYCWGTNEHGELGDGTTTSRSTPAKIADVTDVTAIAAGGAQTCALRKDGVVLCWGDRGGVPTKTPIPVFGLAQATAIAVGPSHACALVAPDGGARCWGDNSLRQLGVPRLADHGLPSEVRDLALAKSIDAGRDATCALDGKGAMLCWGGGLRCTPGPFVEGRLVAVRPAPIPGVDGLVALATGGDRACGVRADGSVVCVKPQGAGPGAAHTCVADPTPALGKVQSIALGVEFGCAVRAGDGVVACWGSNASGQLGDGTTTAHATPTAVHVAS